ncbi:hypothetical protein LEP1GSC188_3097 [Leptospira weilii serovar Topaz str. LT2116]|uniref:Uncharacterized protein n=1 Tax=Leptospira weilii serovar Topaz str. LT2116 TaxID=1088540 RepID=M3GVJ0_9LEPT|nr:hypothetical protein LEP1GSC188_3097 [Leptospira weilii serovar Topaz str. LT2116]
MNYELNFSEIRFVFYTKNLSQNVGIIAEIRGDSDKIEWFWDTL